MQLKLSGQLLKLTFLQAEVETAILGIDIHRANSLSVDMTGSKLVQAGTGHVLSTITSSSGATDIQSELATTPPDFPVSQSRQLHLEDIIVASVFLEGKHHSGQLVFGVASLVCGGVFSSPWLSWPGYQQVEVRDTHRWSRSPCPCQGDHVLTAEGGSHQDHLKLSIVKELFWKWSTSTAFLYRRQPPTDSLKGSIKPTAAVDWTGEMERAFNSAKAALWKAALLAPTRYGRVLALMVDWQIGSH